MKCRNLVRTHAEYSIVLLEAPLAAAEVKSLAKLLGHKGEPWLGDIRRRYAGCGSDYAVVAMHGDEPVSHLWVGADAGYPAFAVLGHVFTLPAHRRQGLSKTLLEIALQHDSVLADRLLVLGVDNPAAIPLYEHAGFRNLHGPDTLGHQVMIRGAAAEDLLAGRWPVLADPLHRVPFGAGHYASGILLLNAFPGDAKLLSLGIMNGHEAELRLLEGMQRAGLEGESLDAFVDGGTGCLLAIEHKTRNGCCRYGVPDMQHK